MSVEAAAAILYWEVWNEVAVRFARRDAPHVPAHWLTVGKRTSPLTLSQRKAVNPANALLNYLYAVLEAECRIAVITMGLDPGMGVLHADQPNRDSLALDVMEAARIEVERYVLKLLRTRTFAAREFFETNQGDCRLVAPLPEQLTGFCEVARAAVAPVAEWVARSLAAGTGGAPLSNPRGDRGLSLPTPLTEANRSAGRVAAGRKRATAPKVQMTETCEECGDGVNNGRRFCDACLPERHARVTANLGIAWPVRLAQLRAEGRDPTATPEARERASEHRRKQHRLDREWEAEYGLPSDGARFRGEILPKLAGIPLRRITEATGLSLTQASAIRRGVHLPHARHWEALKSIGQD